MRNLCFVFLNNTLLQILEEPSQGKLIHYIDYALIQMLYISKLPETWAHTSWGWRDTWWIMTFMQKTVEDVQLKQWICAIKALSTDVHAPSLLITDVQSKIWLKLSLRCSCQHVTLAINQFSFVWENKNLNPAFSLVSRRLIWSCAQDFNFLHKVL